MQDRTPIHDPKILSLLEKRIPKLRDSIIHFFLKIWNFLNANDSQHLPSSSVAPVVHFPPSDLWDVYRSGLYGYVCSYCSKKERLDPSSKFVYARCLCSLGQFEEARHLYENIIDWSRKKSKKSIDHIKNARKNIAFSYFLEKKYDEALDYIDRHFDKEDKVESKLQFIIGDCYLGKDDIEEAKTHYHLLPRIDDLERLVVMYDQLGNHKEVIALYVEAKQTKEDQNTLSFFVILCKAYKAASALEDKDVLVGISEDICAWVPEKPHISMFLFQFFFMVHILESNDQVVVPFITKGWKHMENDLHRLDDLRKMVQEEEERVSYDPEDFDNFHLQHLFLHFIQHVTDEQMDLDTIDSFRMHHLIDSKNSPPLLMHEDRSRLHSTISFENEYQSTIEQHASDEEKTFFLHSDDNESVAYSSSSQIVHFMNEECMDPSDVKKSKMVQDASVFLNQDTTLRQYMKLSFVGRYASPLEAFRYSFPIDEPVLVILWSTRCNGLSIPSKDLFQRTVKSTLESYSNEYSVELQSDTFLLIHNPQLETPCFCIFYELNDVDQNFDCIANQNWIRFDSTVRKNWKEWKDNDFEEAVQQWIAHAPTVVSVHVPLQDDFPIIRIYTLCKDWIPFHMRPLILPSFECKTIGILGSCEGFQITHSRPVRVNRMLPSHQIMQTYFYPPALNIIQNTDQTYSTIQHVEISIGSALVFQDIFSQGFFFTVEDDPDEFKIEAYIDFRTLTCFLDEAFRLTWNKEEVRFALSAGHFRSLLQTAYVSLGKKGSGIFLEYDQDLKCHTMHFEELELQRFGTIVGVFEDGKRIPSSIHDPYRRCDVALIALDPSIVEHVNVETPFQTLFEDPISTLSMPIEIVFKGAASDVSRFECRIIEKAIFRIEEEDVTYISDTCFVICGESEYSRHGDSGSPVYGMGNGAPLYGLMYGSLFNNSTYEPHRCIHLRNFVNGIDDPDNYYRNRSVHISFACSIQNCIEAFRSSSAEIQERILALETGAS